MGRQRIGDVIAPFDPHTRFLQLLVIFGHHDQSDPSGGLGDGYSDEKPRRYDEQGA